MLQKYIGVKQAVKEGFIRCKVNGLADLSYPTSKLRRGRVQGGWSKPYDYNIMWSVQNYGYGTVTVRLGLSQR